MSELQHGYLSYTSHHNLDHELVNSNLTKNLQSNEDITDNPKAAVMKKASTLGYQPNRQAHAPSSRENLIFSFNMYVVNFLSRWDGDDAVHGCFFRPGW